jgi:hypothetical protein
MNLTCLIPISSSMNWWNHRTPIISLCVEMISLIESTSASTSTITSFASSKAATDWFWHRQVHMHKHIPQQMPHRHVTTKTTHDDMLINILQWHSNTKHNSTQYKHSTQQLNTTGACERARARARFMELVLLLVLMLYVRCWFSYVYFVEVFV